MTPKQRYQLALANYRAADKAAEEALNAQEQSQITLTTTRAELYAATVAYSRSVGIEEVA